MTTILTGTICDNTCLGYGPGDDIPDYLALFGPAFGDLMGRPFTLQIGGASDYALTINNHTIAFDVGNPHFSISFTDPLLASFAPGAALFSANGLNPYGFAVAETEYLCPDPVPGVPEPATWALMLIGFGLVAGFARLRKRKLACGHSSPLAC